MDDYKDYNLDVLRAYLESSIRCPLTATEQRELVRVVLAIAEKVEENEMKIGELAQPLLNVIELENKRLFDSL